MHFARNDRGDDSLILFGVINPVSALIPFSPSSRPIDGSYLVWRGDYSSDKTREAFVANGFSLRLLVKFAAAGVILFLVSLIPKYIARKKGINLGGKLDNK